jgi:hypothetical protein
MYAAFVDQFWGLMPASKSESAPTGPAASVAETAARVAMGCGCLEMIPVQC